MKIYLLSITTDDGATWRTLSAHGYYTDKAQAQRAVNKRNQVENGPLVRYEIRESNLIPLEKTFPNSENLLETHLAKLSQAEKLESFNQ